MNAPQRVPTTAVREPAPQETQLLRQLVSVQGRDPGGFSAALLPSGSISVRSPAAAAFYPLDGWTHRFVRHLHQGYFDPRALAQPTRRAN